MLGGGLLAADLLDEEGQVRLEAPDSHPSQGHASGTLDLVRLARERCVDGVLQSSLPDGGQVDLAADLWCWCETVPAAWVQWVKGREQQEQKA